MNARLSTTAKELIDVVLQLADAFGVAASVFTTVNRSCTVGWRRSSFVHRHSGAKASLTVTVVTPADAIGQSCTDEWSLAAAVRTFHLAKNSAVPDPFRLAQLARLSMLEKRSAPLAPAPDKPDKLPASFFREVERYHRYFQNELSPLSVETTCTVGWTQMVAGRSDGSFHQATIWRAECRDEWCNPALQQTAPRRLFTCVSAPSASLLSAAQLTSAAWSKLRTRKWQLSAPSTAAHKENNAAQLLLDGEVTAAILFAAFLSGALDHPPPTTAVITVEPNEGIPGYHPLHPYGYLLAPEVICSARRSDPPYLQALRSHSEQISAHLSLRLPHLDETRQDDKLADLCRRLTSRRLASELDVLQGIDRFHYDAASGLFALLPRWVARWQEDQLQILPPCWLFASFASWLSGCLGGVGPNMLEWPQHGSPWTVSVPQYTLTHIKGG